MRCCVCDEKILVGDKVYPGGNLVWHTECGDGACYAVMGGDGKLRWCGGECAKGSIGRTVRNQERF